MSDIYQFNVGGTTYNLANLGLLAPVQITLTADRLYNTGDQFIYTGLLYEATETIAQGTSITIGSNAQLADCVTKQISEINSNLEYRIDTLSLPVGQYGTVSYNHVAKFGKALSIEFKGQLNSSIVGAAGLIATLPADFTPSVAIPCILRCTYGGTAGVYNAQINTNGTIVTAIGGNTVTGTVDIICSAVM